MFSDVVCALRVGEMASMPVGGGGGAEEVEMEAMEAELGVACIVAVLGRVDRVRVDTTLHWREGREGGREVGKEGRERGREGGEGKREESTPKIFST